MTAASRPADDLLPHDLPDRRPATTDVVRAVAGELAAEPAPLLSVAIDWLSTRLPDYVTAVTDAGEDVEVMTSTLLDILVAGLQSRGELSLYEYWDVVRELGRRRCEQGIDMETLLEVMSIHRDVVREVFSSMTRELGAAEGAIRHVERRLDVLVEKLTVSLTLGYVDSWEQRYEDRQAELNALIAITRAINSSLELPEIAQAGLRETLQTMRLDAGALWLADSHGSLGLAQVSGLPPDEEALLNEWPAEESPFMREVISAREPRQAHVKPRVATLRRFASALAVSLRSVAGDLLGVLAVGSMTPRIFSDSEVAFIGNVAEHLVVALEHARQHQREARTDFLTGLANRQEFEHTLERHIAAARRSAKPLMIALLDLDNLKTINDTLGHHAGDKAIRALGQALRRGVRASDISARLGGDEFAVALPDLNQAEAERLSRRIRRLLAEIAQAEAIPLPLSCSFGFAEWTPGVDAQALFQAADKDLYRDKRRSHARIRRAERRRTHHSVRVQADRLAAS